MFLSVVESMEYFTCYIRGSANGENRPGGTGSAEPVYKVYN